MHAGAFYFGPESINNRPQYLLQSYDVINEIIRETAFRLFAYRDDRLPASSLILWVYCSGEMLRERGTWQMDRLRARWILDTARFLGKLCFRAAGTTLPKIHTTIFHTVTPIYT
ncbi:hypothetical protein Zmor_009677 [Zophobas morio]|uniref:Uncharacterized protein n=1 Tax=Zophobas morio TaxID=2755281 RepID=A0AA38IM37_9CUCU|nr:hypothetical protein Zmor_009677 [Zophobas morio]